MKKRNLINTIITVGLFLLFCTYTIIVKFVDVAPAGDSQQLVGLSALNQAVFSGLGVSLFWNRLTIYLGYVIFLIPIIFGGIALYQWIKRKKLNLIDREFFILLAFYVAVASFYIFFEEMVINNRPVLVDGAIEASYPSSHTLFACTIIGSAMILVADKIKNKKISISIICMLAGLLIVSVIGRLLSGVHWLTDIVGGILLGSTLVFLFYTGISYYKSSKSPTAEERVESAMQDITPETENL